VAAVIVELGPLTDADDVFEQQRVQPVVLADSLDQVHLMQAVDVDPDVGRPVLERERLLGGVDFGFGTAVGIVIEDGEADLLGLFLAGVDERAGRQTHALGFMLPRSRHDRLLPQPPRDVEPFDGDEHPERQARPGEPGTLNGEREVGAGHQSERC